MRKSAWTDLLTRKAVLLAALGFGSACKSNPSGACVSAGCSDPEECSQPLCYNVATVNDCQLDSESRPFEFVKKETCSSLGYERCEKLDDNYSNLSCSGGAGGAGGAGGDSGIDNKDALSDGICCEAHGQLGCVDPVVQSCVCDQDRFCCSDGWDEVCVEKAVSLNCTVCSE